MSENPEEVSIKVENNHSWQEPIARSKNDIKWHLKYSNFECVIYKDGRFSALKNLSLFQIDKSHEKHVVIIRQIERRKII
jgi:hypothetical protein